MGHLSLVSFPNPLKNTHTHKHTQISSLKSHIKWKPSWGSSQLLNEGNEPWWIQGVCLQNVPKGGDSPFTIYHQYCHFREHNPTLILLVTSVGPLCSCPFQVSPKCTCKIDICKFHGLRIEILSHHSSPITNRTDHRAGVYFIIMMLFKIPWAKFTQLI